MKTTKFEPHYMASRDEVEAHFGYPTRRALEVFSTNGDGPKMTKIGRRCFYRLSDVDIWLRSFEVEKSSEQANAG